MELLNQKLFICCIIKKIIRTYVNYLNDSKKFDKANFVLLIERCYTDDDCKYAYLDVYDR